MFVMKKYAESNQIKSYVVLYSRDLISLTNIPFYIIALLPVPYLFISLINLGAMCMYMYKQVGYTSLNSSFPPYHHT